MRYCLLLLISIFFLAPYDVHASDSILTPSSLIEMAQQGDAEAQYTLGKMYTEEEKWSDEDYEEGVKWLLKAAEQGHRDAQYNIGIRYSFGKGVSQDYKEAMKWVEKAAKQGSVEAQDYLGVMYYHEKGVPQDYKEAYAWFSIAAAQGYDKAVENRDILSEKLSPEALSEAQDLSRKYHKKYVAPFR